MKRRVVDFDQGTNLDKWAPSATSDDIACLSDDHEATNLDLDDIAVHTRRNRCIAGQWPLGVGPKQEPVLTEHEITLTPGG